MTALATVPWGVKTSPLVGDTEETVTPPSRTSGVPIEIQVLVPDGSTCTVSVLPSSLTEIRDCTFRVTAELRATRMEPTAPRSPAVKRWLFNALDMLGKVTAASVPAMLAVTSVSRSVNPLGIFLLRAGERLRDGPWRLEKQIPCHNMCRKLVELSEMSMVFAIAYCDMIGTKLIAYY